MKPPKPRKLGRLFSLVAAQGAGSILIHEKLFVGVALRKRRV